MTPLADRWGYATTPGFDGWEPERVAGELAELGYRCIEWTPDFCAVDGEATRTVAGLFDASRAAGLRISQLMAMADYVTGAPAQRAEKIDLTCEIVDAAAASGIAMVGIYAGPDSWDDEAPRLFDDIAAAEAWDRVFSALDRVFAHAEGQEVLLSFKPCIGTLAFDYYSSLPVIERYGDSKAFAINYDPSHFALFGNDVSWTLASLGRALRHVQIKDVFGIPGTEGRHFAFPLIGEGIVPWRAFFDGLDKADYDGPLVGLFEAYGLFEGFLAGDPIAAARVTMERLRLLERVAAGSARA